MICPACAEEIKDQAVVCRHCGQNLSLTKSLQVRIADLEVALQEAQLQRAAASGGQVAGASLTLAEVVGILALQTRLLFAVAILSCILVFGASLNWLANGAGAPLPVLLGLLFPVVPGFWLRLKLQKVCILRLMISGALIGAATLSWRIILLALQSQLGPPSGWRDYLVVAGIAVVPGLLLTSGSLAAGWMQRLKSPAPQSDLAYRIAFRLGTVGRRHSAPAGDQLVQTVATLISAVAPLLTFISTIIVAYLTYLAATVGKAAEH